MISYIFFRIIIFLYKITPLWLVYIYSDILFFLFFYVIKYRKKVVFSNLKNSFPDKSEEEIYIIAKKYYKHLADIMLESFKGYTLNADKLLKRFSVANPEIERILFEKGENIVFVGGHYGNWEWGTRATPYLLLHDVVILYKPLKNKYIDAYLNRLREKDNTKMQSIFTTGRAFHNHTKPYTVIMVSDQNPANKKKAIWLDFLNQPTACLHGVELYAKKYKMPVVFFNISKIKRGYYEIDFELITSDPTQEAKGQIVKKFMNSLEKRIIQKPEYWLWSHKRWKAKIKPEKALWVD